MQWDIDGVDYMMFDELPQIFRDGVPGHYLTIPDRVTREIVPVPYPPEESVEGGITQLEAENAFLALELATTQGRLDKTEQEQANRSSRPIIA